MRKENQYSIEEWKGILRSGDLVVCENHRFEEEIAILLRFKPSDHMMGRIFDCYEVYNIELMKYETWTIGMFYKYED